MKVTKRSCRLWRKNKRPRPIYYAPPPPIGVVIYPGYGYYGRGSGSTVPTDSTADTVIGVLIITGGNHQA